MAKSPSPVRLQQDLMLAASTAGQRQHRSAAEQIEYWASLGRSVSKAVNPDNLLEVTAGLSEIKVVPIRVPPINPDDVFATVERDRCSGQLQGVISASSVRYQASSEYPGQLERINADGSSTVGQFSMGAFIEMSPNAQ